MGDFLTGIRIAGTSLLVIVTLAVILLLIVAFFILAIGVIWGNLFGGNGFAVGVDVWGTLRWSVPGGPIPG